MLGARRGSSSSASLTRSRASTTDSTTQQQQQQVVSLHYQIQQSPVADTRSVEGVDEIALVDSKSSWATVLQRRWHARRVRGRRVAFWATALGVFALGLALAFVVPQSLQALAPVVIGSLLSFVAALVILVSYLLQPQNRRYPNELLVYVALCEFGLAVLALVHVALYCALSDDASATCAPMNMRVCSLLSALEMFLLLAGVGWFGAAILHLFVSVSNPFANYNRQLRLYHGVVWTSSIAVAVVVPLVVFSRSFQDSYDMSSVELCRAVGLVLPLLPAAPTREVQHARIAQWQMLNAIYWGTLFALIVLLVVAAQSILVVGWWRSNSGTVIALKARRRMMKRMTIYVHALNATWLMILVAFFVYRSNGDALAQLPFVASTPLSPAEDSTGVNVLYAIFHYLLAAKGYFACVVWVSVNKHGCALQALLCGCCRRASATGDGATEDETVSEQLQQHTLHMSSSHNALAWSASSLVMLEGGTRTEPLIPETTSSTSSSASSTWASQNNETLQREIIYYTVCGITKSILKSLQLPDANVFFQQLLVGAERDSAFSNNSIISHVQSIDTMSSPRPFCQQPLSLSAGPASSSGASALHRRVPGDSCNNTECATASCTTPSSIVSQRASFVSSSSQQVLSSSFTAHGRFSLYPVSQVPFELFDHEIELQSSRSSSVGRSPLFAGIRRTAFGQNATANASGIDDPKPKVFIDYAPSEFRAIRRAFGLSDETYLASFRTTAKERISAGSSGAFMFFSGDNALIVKSMKEKECRKLVKMIPAYSAYLQRAPTSRIIRFFGCHRIRLYGRNFYFVVMSNVLHSVKHAATISEKYDVKGSWIDRRARRPQVGDSVTCSECNAPFVFGREDAATTFPFHMHRPDTILKDLDLDRTLHLPRDVATRLHAQLVADAEFLNSMGIMDYSLLVGIHKCRLAPAVDVWPLPQDLTASAIREDPRESRSSAALSKRASSGSHLAPLERDSDGSMEVYFVGIIDILQEWDWEKQMEKVGKMLIGKSGSGISAIPPDAYCERFKARITQILLGDISDSDDDDSAANPRAVLAALSETSLDALAHAAQRPSPRTSAASSEHDATGEDAEEAFQREAASLV